ncbi:hypothetical protein LOTGIDRAFT_234845 [Lottia gigantea]|uniref:Superoxide dismutase copper/zinc binding domain-containing protein n=1 Tax=Lottia gigantea TaxID=225164 RepID=V3ZU06_LOTGI|nr:hypothetical protein LOTGIDRAFT_234845 [Lottia gigantea]ESO87832.1 hypothetical protein LOTGIDRAFT_234845 [Lottia gigantea]
MKVFLLVTCFMLSLIVDISDSRPELFPFLKSECSSGVVYATCYMKQRGGDDDGGDDRGGDGGDDRRGDDRDDDRGGRRDRDNDGNDDRRDGNDDRRDGNDDRRDGNDNDGGVRGNIYFSQKVDSNCRPTSELKVRVRLRGVNGGDDDDRDGRDRGDNGGGDDDDDGRRRRFLGLHVHKFGDLRNRCLAAGPHLRKLGNFRSNRRGNIQENFRVKQTSLVEIVGRAVVLHSRKNAGRRLACCVIGYADSRK